MNKFWTFLFGRRYRVVRIEGGYKIQYRDGLSPFGDEKWRNLYGSPTTSESIAKEYIDIDKADREHERNRKKIRVVYKTREYGA